MPVSNTYAGREPVTRREHVKPWIANLESDVHAMNCHLTVEEALDAIEQTRKRQFVDLVTHEHHGHPEAYLYDAIRSVEHRVVLTDEGRCSCGGYVTRVRVGTRN